MCERQPSLKYQRNFDNAKSLSSGTLLYSISLNAHYVVALKIVRDKKFMYLAQQEYPEDSLRLYNACLDAIQRPHDYLILDLTQDKNDGLRLRTNIFPTEYTPVEYSDICDEACGIELSRPSPAQGSRNEIA